MNAYIPGLKSQLLSHTTLLSNKEVRDISHSKLLLTPVLLHAVPGPVLRPLQKDEKIRTTQGLKCRELGTEVMEESRAKERTVK